VELGENHSPHIAVAFCWGNRKPILTATHTHCTVSIKVVECCTVPDEPVTLSA
jgi:hypothetical protein